jgi:dipeptidyl-peptidase-4
MPIKQISFLLFFLFLTANLYSQKKELTYQQVYGRKGPSLTNPITSIENWLDDEHYLITKSMEGSKTSPLVKVNAETGEEEIFLDYDKINELLPDGPKLSKYSENSSNFNSFYFSKRTDSYVYIRDENKLIKLPESQSKRNNATFSPDGRLIAFTRDRNLFVLNIAEGREKQLTFDGSDLLLNGWSSWIYYEEILGRSTRHKAFWWSHDSRHISFMKFDDSTVPEYLLYDASGVHGEWESTRYPKVGDPNPLVEIGIANVETGDITWVDLDLDPEDYVAWPLWLKDSKHVYYQWVNRGWDNIKVFRADINSGQTTEVYDEKQKSWVYFFEDIYFFENEPGFLVRTDKDGWRHLYHYDADGNLISQITSGDWHVKKLALVDEANDRIFFEADRDGFVDRHIYSINIDGTNLRKLTEVEGTHRSDVSPGGSYIIDTYSNITQPNRMDLLDNTGKFIRRLGDAYSKNLEEYKIGKIKLSTIPTPDGLELPLKLILPPDFDENKKYPIMFSVYGGPEAGGVSNSWPRRSSAFYWAQKGIIYAGVDNRGTEHFSKDIIGQLHRNLGKVEIDDFITVGKYVSELPYIDPDKIGISGGSYGGYAVLMALTRGADYFDCGIASASVTDWRLYDNVYTERFMDSYEENKEGYEFGSVMTHADKLKGNCW